MLGRLGIRVNSIAPGEIDTSILSPGTEKIVEQQIPMHRLGTPDEVRAMMPGALLEVRTSAPRRTALLLREHLAGASVGLFGDRVHVVARDVAATQAAIRELVASAGFALLGLQPVEPSLEDVFVSITANPDPATNPGLSFNR